MSERKEFHITSNWPNGQRASRDIKHNVESATRETKRTRGAVTVLEV